jgi:hypothetical protein
MKNILMLSILLTISLYSICQVDNSITINNLIIKLFDEKVLQPKDLMKIIDHDSCINIGHSCKNLHPDKIYVLSASNYQNIRVSASKNIFMDDIQSWIRIYKCELIETKVSFHIDVIIENRIIRQGVIEFVRIDGVWKINRKRVKNMNKEFSWFMMIRSEN